jgi:hypothetical protein
MKLVPESINEALSFTKGNDPLTSLGVGVNYLIKKWLDSSTKRQNEYTIKDNRVIFKDNIWNNKIKEWQKLIIPYNVLKNLFTDEQIPIDSKEYDSGFIIYIIQNIDNNYNWIDKLFKMFPKKVKLIVSILKKFTYNKDLTSYLEKNHPEIIEENPFAYSRYGSSNITSISDLDKKLSGMTPNQRLQVSIYKKYDKGVIDALKAGANPYTQFNKYLDWAVDNGNLDILKLMAKDERLKKNIDKSDVRFLMRAIHGDKLDIVKILLPLYDNVDFGQQQWKKYHAYAIKNNLPLR